MTYVPHVQTQKLTLGHEDARGDFAPVVDLTLVGNNEKPQRSGRLAFQFKDDYPAEVEIEPGPDCHPKGNIVSQIMQWGPTTSDGKNRNRITTSIVADPAGGLSCVIDSSTNDPSGSEGQSKAMPLVLNAGEGKGIYLVLHPSDNTISVQDRVSGKSVRTPVTKLIEVLSR